MKFRLSYSTLNLVLLIGLFFEGNTLGLYFCTFVPFLILFYQNKGVLKTNSISTFAVIFFANICLQTLAGYPPNIKLTLNFFGNLIMIYSIFSTTTVSPMRDHQVLNWKWKMILDLHIVVVVVMMMGLLREIREMWFKKIIGNFSMREAGELSFWICSFWKKSSFVMLSLYTHLTLRTI